jgi:hypothetical protein
MDALAPTIGRPGTVMQGRASLQGRRVLVVEDEAVEALIA